MLEAIPGDAAYLEAHIEQGPVLEEKDCATGIVTTIAAQFRIHITIYGKAGHAGTTPMDHRQDALCTAVELIGLIEETAKNDGDLRATVGQIRVEPDASNVIPDACYLTLDIRHPQTSALEDLTEYIHACALTIAANRRTRLHWDYLQRSNAVDMSLEVQQALAASALAIQGKAPSLPSGAGHDAVIMSSIAPVAMLFVRCREGLSHHPDEHVKPEDIDTALQVISNAISYYADNYNEDAAEGG